MRNGKYQLYKKIMLEYYFYRTLNRDHDLGDFDRIEKLQQVQLITKKFMKIPSSSRFDVEKILLSNKLLKPYTWYGMSLHELTEDGVKDAVKIMTDRI